MASVPTRFGVGPGPVCVIANHVYIVRAPALGAYLETACTCLFAPDSFCPDNFCIVKNYTTIHCLHQTDVADSKKMRMPSRMSIYLVDDIVIV